jgi:hypothetical protein
MPSLFGTRAIAPLLAMVLAAACGSNSSPGAAVSSPTSDPLGTVPASGDIPDNVVWLNYSGSGFSIQYPEGWVRSTSPNGVAFSDKDSRITVAINAGPAPTKQSITSEIAAIAGAQITAAAHQLSMPAGTAIKMSYTVDGSPDPVTGKRPHLTVDRYEIGASGRMVVLELAAQVGVDNVDAYLVIAKSFKWTA